MQDQTERTNWNIRKHLLADEHELDGQFQKAQPKHALASERVGTCSRESDKEFNGDYLSIDLRDCSNIIIRNAHVGKLNVLNSRLTLIDTDILGGEVGLHADNSDITITNGDISGVTAIKSERSRFDLAGVYLVGSKDAVKAAGSKFVFSISRAHSPHTDGALHFYRKMNDGVL
jgi:hypothetical protein